MRSIIWCNPWFLRNYRHENERFWYCLVKEKIHSVPSDGASVSFSARNVEKNIFVKSFPKHDNQLAVTHVYAIQHKISIQTYVSRCLQEFFLKLSEISFTDSENRPIFKVLLHDQRDLNSPRHSISGSIRHQTILAPTATNGTFLHLLLITSSNSIQQTET